MLLIISDLFWVVGAACSRDHLILAKQIRYRPPPDKTNL